jgi:hypothetical protein
LILLLLLLYLRRLLLLQGWHGPSWLMLLGVFLLLLRLLRVDVRLGKGAW